MHPQSHVWDQLVAAQATRQHGVVAFRQLIELGLSPGAVKTRVRAGRLHRLHRGVFAVGHRSVSRKGELMAAVLAYGSDALVSHWTAAELWGFSKASRTVIDVVGAADRRPRPGIAFRQLRTLHPRERTKRHNIPVTSAVRTLLDVATVAEPRQVRASSVRPSAAVG